MPAWLVAIALLAGDPGEAERAVAQAKNAFEYRDFKRVIEILDPWLNPPRIPQPEHLRTARQLIGIALHIDGNIDEAKRHFADVLLEDPDLVLDPFLVPPAVIETFEAVKLEMGPVLDRIRPPKAPAPPPPLPAIEIRDVPSPMLAFVPLGVGLFEANETGWALTWLGLQVAGLIMNVAGYWVGQNLAEDDPGLSAARGVWASGLGILAVSLVAGTIHGYVALDALGADPRAASPAGPSAAISISIPVDLSGAFGAGY